MAFQLYISDTPVDLDPASSISLNFVCPAFDDDSAERGYSLPFRLPLTAATQMLLKHRQRLDTSDVGESIAAKVFIESQDLAKGVYKLEKSPRGFLDGHFENEARANLASLAQLKLQNLLPVISIPQTVLPRWYLQVRPQNIATGYSMSIDDVPFSSDNGTSLANGINSHFGETLAVYDGNVTVTLSPPADGRSLKIINQTPYYNGITLLTTSHSQVGAQQESFRDFVRASLVTPRTDMSFALMQNTKLYEAKNTAWSGLINFAEYTDVLWHVAQAMPTTDATAWQYTFVPFVRVSYLLSLIAQKMGVSVVAGDFTEFAELQTLLVYNNRSMDDIKQAYEFSELKYTNAHAKEIALKNHVPDMTVAEFLSQYCETFNLWWSIVDERLLFRKKDSLLRGQAAADWSAYLVAGSDERGYKTSDGLKFYYKNDETDAATSTALNAYTEGNGGELITLPTGALPEKVVESAKEACFSEQTRSETVGVLRFMFDRGKQAETSERHYLPTASAARFGALSLSPTFLFNAFWQKSAQYRAYAWYYAASFELPLFVLRKTLEWEQALRRIETPDGSVVAAIQTIEVTEKVNGSAAVKVEFWVKN